MSYLQKKAGHPSFTEIIISVWVRVPHETMDAIEYDNQADPSPIFNGIVPFLVLGEAGEEDNKYDYNPAPALWMTTDFSCDGVFMDTHAEVISSECTSYHDFYFIYFFHCCLVHITQTMYTATPSTDFVCIPYHKEENHIVYSPEPAEVQKSPPTCIGVDRDGYLFVCFQTNQRPSVEGEGDDEVVTSITPGENISTSGNMGYKEGMETRTVYYDGGLLGCVGLIDHSTVVGPTVSPAVSSTGRYKQPVEHKTKFPALPYETGKFYSGGMDTQFGNNIRLSPDRWHHVLVSVKLKTTKTQNYTWSGGPIHYGFKGGSQLYVALDDKNYTKDDLNSGAWGWGGYSGDITDPNEVYPDKAWDVATDYYDPDRPDWPQATYTLTNPQVPAGDIGLPATEKYVDKIRRVEMAELQIWFGQSFDTGKEENRRLFIDSEGKPVKIEDKVAENRLGKPDIMLHGSSDWKRGINKGALAPPSGSGGPEPWFTPKPDKDGIVRWQPDPSLHGPQNPGEKPRS